jgi:hypothetical protein
MSATHITSTQNVAKQGRAATARGRLRRSPYSGSAYESELVPWPLSRPREYASAVFFERSSEQPVLLSPRQRDLWLAEIVSAAKQRIPGMTLAIIRMGGPQAQLPPGLLDQDVLLANEPGPAVALVLAAGRTGVLEVWHDIRTDGIEAGGNNLVLTMHGAECVVPFMEFVTDNPLLSSLEGLSISCLEPDCASPWESSVQQSAQQVPRTVTRSTTAASPMQRVELAAALHWHIIPPFAQENPELPAQIALLGRCIAAQVRAVVPLDVEGPVPFVLSSTVASGAISSMEPVSRLLFDAVESSCGRRPLAFLHAYLCTGWGYALAFLLRHTTARAVLLSIVDVDVHDLAYHHDHPLIGKSGFGITTLLLRIPRERTGLVETGGPFSGSALKEFLLAAKAHVARHEPAMSFMPFFGPAMGPVVQRILGKINLGPNRHDVYGHCYGSDPWIGLIEWLQQNPIDRDVHVTVGMVALLGYFTLCDVGISVATKVGFRVLDGNETELEAASAEPTRGMSSSPYYSNGDTSWT